MSARICVAVCLLLAASIAPLSSADASAVSLSGDWQGTLDAGVELRLVVHLEVTEDGGLTGTLDSIDQGAMGLPIDTVHLDGRVLRLELSVVGGVYEGTLDESGERIEGSWSQGGATLPLILERTDEPPQINRPQEPEKPYPYNEEDVVFVNASASTADDAPIELAGTLTSPKQGAPHPAVVLVSGSGPQDRDETVFGHRPFLVLSDYLTRRGIAVLRYDDRGVGDSGGDFATATSRDFAGDAAAAVAYLRSRPEIDAERIGVLGHSEGGLIAPMVAADDPELAFVVLVAGPGVSGREILILQSELIMSASGVPAATIQENQEVQKKAFDLLQQEPDNDKAYAAIREMFLAQIAEMTDAERAALGGAEPDQIAEQQAQQISNPWFRYFLEYDPRAALGKVRCPVLAVNGEKDLQVDSDQNLPEILAALADGPCTDFTTVQLPSLNHLLQTAGSGALAEYAGIEETIAPLALRTIGDWIVSRTTRPSAE